MLAANYANINDNLYTSNDLEWLDLPQFSGYAIGYGLESFLGPIEARYTFSPEIKQHYWFFNLGFWF